MDATQWGRILEAAAIATWTFVSEIPIPDDVMPMMVQGETAIAAYKTFRDSAVFTSKRLIVRDAQGITGKKVELYSLPYSSINMWSSENVGTSRSSWPKGSTFVASTC